MSVAFPYVWRWRRYRPAPDLAPRWYVQHPYADRAGQRCRVIARGTSMNSALVEFQADGHRAVVSRYATHRHTIMTGESQS